MSRCFLNEGQIIYGKYFVIEHLGKGEFADVYKTKDSVDRHFAIKVFRHGSEFRPYFDNEFKILYKLGSQKNPNIVNFVEAFCHLNMNTDTFQSTIHPCIVTELLGDDLLNVFRYIGGGLPINLVKKFTQQLTHAIDYIHSHNIIYVDIKSENILLDKSVEQLDNDEDANVCLIDFNSSTDADNLFHRSVGTQEYLSPELIVEAKYTKATDIWSLMCMVYEMVTGDDLFMLDDDDDNDADDDNDDDDADEDETKVCKHLILIEGLLGTIPSEIVRDGNKYRKYFNNRGKLKNNPEIQKYTILEKLAEYEDIKSEDIVQLVEFLLFGLKLDPKQRPTCKQILAHPWMSVLEKSKV